MGAASVWAFGIRQDVGVAGTCCCWACFSPESSPVPVPSSVASMAAWMGDPPCISSPDACRGSRVQTGRDRMGQGRGEKPPFRSDASGITLVKETGQLTTPGSKVWPKGVQVAVSIIPCPSIMYCPERRKRPPGKFACRKRF